jgi:hypothetical protein
MYTAREQDNWTDGHKELWEVRTVRQHNSSFLRLDVTVTEFSRNIVDNIAQGIYFVLCSFSSSITPSPQTPFKKQDAKAELSETKQLLTVLIRLMVWRLIQKCADKKTMKQNSIFSFS